MKTILKKILVILPAVILEALIIGLLVTIFRPWAAFFEGVFRFLGFLFALFVISYRQEGTYKILWLLFFTAAPIPAAVAYLMWGNKRTVKPITDKVGKAQETIGIHMDDSGILSDPAKEDERTAESLRYVETLSGAPAQTDRKHTVLSALVRIARKAMLTEIEKGRKVYLSGIFYYSGRRHVG